MAETLITQKILIFNNEGKFLAVRRSKTDPSKPLAWDVPGSVLEEGEDVKEGILREVKEEVGLDISKPEILDVFNYVSPKGEYYVCVGYKATAISTDVVLSYEHDIYEWLNKEEFLTRDSKKHIQELVRKV